MKKTFLRLKTFILVKDLKTLVIVPYQKLSCYQNLIFGTRLFVQKIKSDTEHRFHLKKQSSYKLLPSDLSTNSHFEISQQ